jgi:hypothetical protein
MVKLNGEMPEKTFFYPYIKLIGYLSMLASFQKTLDSRVTTW